MAKKKEDKVESINPTDVLFKELGSVLVPGLDVSKEERQVIPFSPSLDIGLNGGIQEGGWLIISGPPKGGKALTLDSDVYTPTGPKKMKDIQIGDVVCTPTGTAKVTGVYPQKQVKDVYRVYFSDRTDVDCSLSHLWTVKKEPSGQEFTLTTKQIILSGLYCGKKIARPKWYVETPKKLELTKTNYIIDPYILGVLIGDGCLTGYGVRFSNIDEELIKNLIKLLPDGYEIRRINSSDGSQDSHFITNAKDYSNNIISKELNKLNLRCTSHFKFIPNEYKYGSYQDRLSLIQGLMDTDGYIGKEKNRLEYSTTSFQLAKDFKEIFNSIGGLCKIKRRYTKCNGKEFVSFRCSLRIDDPTIIFRLSRKLARCHIRKKKSIKKRIINIEFVGRKKMQCITIDDPRGIFLTNYYTPTHNSSSLLHFAGNCQKEEYGGRHVYYLDVEGRLKKKNLFGTPGLNLDKFSVVRSTEDKILSAQNYLSYAEKILHTHKSCVVVIDSFSALCHEKELTEGIGTSTRGAGAYTLLAQFCRQLGNVVQVKKSIVIGVLHLMANVSGYGAHWLEKGGNSIQYQLDTRLRIKGKEPWETTDKRRIGQKINWIVEETALGAPGAEVTSYLRYGQGIDELSELLDYGINIGLIGKGGAWYETTFLEKHNLEVKKYQGIDNLYQGFKENEGWGKLLEKEIKEFVGVK